MYPLLPRCLFMDELLTLCLFMDEKGEFLLIREDILSEFSDEEFKEFLYGVWYYDPVRECFCNQLGQKVTYCYLGLLQSEAIDENQWIAEQKKQDAEKRKDAAQCFMVAIFIGMLGVVLSFVLV